MSEIPPYVKYQAAHSGHDCDTHGDGDGIGALIIIFLKAIVVLLVIWIVFCLSKKLCIFLKPYFALATEVLKDNGLFSITSLTIIAWGVTLCVLMLSLFFS